MIDPVLMHIPMKFYYRKYMLKTKRNLLSEMVGHTTASAQFPPCGIAGDHNFRRNPEGAAQNPGLVLHD